MSIVQEKRCLGKGEFRPISLLDIPSKILESIIVDSVDYHMVNNLGRLYMHQWAFMKGRSTELLLLHLTEKMPLIKEKLLLYCLLISRKL